jgi:HSP20 family protein
MMPSWTLFDDFIDKIFHDDFANESKLMAVDVIERENAFQIKANLPGIKKENINISIKENQLIISAHYEAKDSLQEESMLRVERYQGKYQRLFTLPDNCDKENIKATVEKGVLILTIKKSDPVPPKLITISD